MSITPLKTNEFENAVKEGYSVLDYWATWCGPCRQLAPIMEELSQNYENIDFYSIDVDQEPELAAAQRISSIPTLLLYRDGKIVERITGAGSKASLTKAFDWLATS